MCGITLRRLKYVCELHTSERDFKRAAHRDESAEG